MKLALEATSSDKARVLRYLPGTTRTKCHSEGKLSLPQCEIPRVQIQGKELRTFRQMLPLVSCEDLQHPFYQKIKVLVKRTYLQSKKAPLTLHHLDVPLVQSSSNVGVMVSSALACCWRILAPLTVLAPLHKALKIKGIEG